ncbi:HIT family protein [Candidatus Saccharibacteria bacterium CPR2]|nr:HIT family protein [Candidatus Saccharibacteria bacterium CPR2]
MAESIFTKIIKGEIPCHKVYEDDKVIAFLDIHPVSEGHTLVVSKKQIDHLWDLEDDLYLHLMSVSKKIANRIREVINPPRVGVMVEGFEVPHAHYHIFPLYKGLKATMAEYSPELEPDHSKLAQTAKKLRLD